MILVFADAQVATAQGSEWDYVLLSTVRRNHGMHGLLDLAHHGGTDANVIDVVFLKSLANMRKSVFRSHETFLGYQYVRLTMSNLYVRILP